MPAMMIEPKRSSPDGTYTRPTSVEWMDEEYEPCGLCGEQGRIWADGAKGPGVYACARCGGLGRGVRLISLLDD